MEVTVTTWAIALIGLGLISLLASLQLVAVLRPACDLDRRQRVRRVTRSDRPRRLLRVQPGQCLGRPILVGTAADRRQHRHAPRRAVGIPACAHGLGAVLVHVGVLLHLGPRPRLPENTFNYWFVIWGMWPVFGVTEGVYCFVRLLE